MHLPCPTLVVPPAASSPLSGLSLPAVPSLPLRAAHSAPWPLLPWSPRPWQVGQPRPTLPSLETVNPGRDEGSRAAGQKGGIELREGVLEGAGGCP